VDSDFDAMPRRLQQDQHAKKVAQTMAAASAMAVPSALGGGSAALLWEDLEQLLRGLPDKQRRAAQSLLCLAVGDAAGLPFEFRQEKREQIEQCCDGYRQRPGPASQKQIDSCIRRSIESRTSGRPAGTSFCRTFSDDTACTDLKMQSVAKIATLGRGASRPEFFRQLMSEYICWASNARGNLFQGTGGFTRSFLRPRKSQCRNVSQAGNEPTAEFLTYAESFFGGELPNTWPSWGNGAVMSFAPQAVLMSAAGHEAIAGEVLAGADILSSTHRHHTAQKGAQLLGDLLLQLYNSDIKDFAELLPACVHCEVWKELREMAVHDNHGYIYPIRELEAVARVGDCSAEDADAFLHNLTGKHNLLREECYGCFGELLRVASNFGEIEYIYARNTKEPVKFSQRGLNSVIIAIWCVAGSRSMMDVLERLLYVGGDTDTIGAVAGQFVGPLLSAEEVCHYFKRFVALDGIETDGAEHLEVAAASAKRFFYRSVHFASSNWAELLLHRPLSDPIYEGLTDESGMRLKKLTTIADPMSLKKQIGNRSNKKKKGKF